jgi:hypothetical protein
MRPYACNGKSSGYLMWLAMFAYGAAAMVGQIVYILDEGRA